MSSRDRRQSSSGTRKRRILSGLGVGLALLLASGMARAQDADAPTYSLEGAIAQALRDSRDLRMARLDLESAGQQVREAWGTLFPSVDASLRYQRNLRVEEVFLPAIIFDPDAPSDELVPVRFGADNNWSAELSVSQPLFDAGAFIGVSTAGRFEELQVERVRGRTQAVASRVRRAYYGALLAGEEVRLTRESVKRTEETLEETQALQRAGLASSYDVLRLEVRLANARPDLRRAVNAVAAAERDLAVEMGLDDVERVGVAGELHLVSLTSPESNEGPNAELLQLVGYEEPLGASFEELRRTAMAMRSDLRQAQLNRELEGARAAVERTEFFPRLSAFFSYGLTAQENGSLDPFGESSNQRTTRAQLGVQLEVPVFQGFQRSARLQQRQLAERQADVRFHQLEQQIEDEIRTALERLEEARSRAEASSRAVDQARRGYEIVTAEYLAGTVSQLEVTDGEVALRESEFNYAQAVHDYLSAQADLDEAVGIVPVVDPVKAPDSGTSISHAVKQTERGFGRQ